MRIIECDRCHKRFKKDAKKTGYVNLDQRDIKTGIDVADTVTADRKESA